ncbi:hypothetical protein NFI96_034100 [Prochilodus magdalenae]|nr:hypothetical protein NFI96_034100 [Prochilodus magdalenae]
MLGYRGSELKEGVPSFKEFAAFVTFEADIACNPIPSLYALRSWNQLFVAPLPYVTDLTQSDQYGCVHWQPEEPPFGGNDETLEEKRKQMLQLHSYEGMTGADREEVCKLMEVTYYHQRQDINAVSHSSLYSLKSSWSYLFCLKVFSTHFQLLTDIPLLTGIMEGFQAKGKRILIFFEEKPTNNEVCAIVLKSGQ